MSALVFIIISFVAIIAFILVVIADEKGNGCRVKPLACRKPRPPVPPPAQKPRPKREHTALLTSTTALQTDIQACTDRLVNARLARDKQQETEELLRMESLMVSAAQQLQCIIDYLKEEK